MDCIEDSRAALEMAVTVNNYIGDI